ncbi:putative membrane protein YeiB [Thermocatellispora tengchongensis]|uniref:Putative membrane protein YeiB n=1 Tax=Thermocatellispora tengchongensis TaxID=1073253 RepID=A0A840NVX1_9ACTN|nr:DUF418 domain-containing protein [Thermocatellispora tengchongensis]MBB5130326.1 putative membrane protein YeiB [Thermocatellispora tengchongensis]
MHHDPLSPPAVPDAPPPAPRPGVALRRISALDVIRGFALCGILLVNVEPIADAGRVVLPDSPGGTAGVTDGVDAWLGVLVAQRFFPIFSLLFGIGFSLMFRSAGDRAPRPRVILLRRLLVLLLIGAAHFALLWQGDILSTYAVVGLVVLLPSTWLPRWAVAVLAAAFLATSTAIGDNRLTLVAGLFLLGSALTRFGVIDRLESSTRVPALLALAFAAGAAPFLWLQVSAASAVAFQLAGLMLAGAYVCVLLVLLRTPLRTALHALFTPLGRMALTNYLSATVAVLLISRLIGGAPHEWPSATVFLIAGAILAVQWVFSTLWLRRYRQGPLEWLWRWATWARRPPLRAPGRGEY